MKAFPCRRISGAGFRPLPFSALLLLLLPVSVQLSAQHVELNLIATDTLADARILTIGVDPAATDNIDPSLGEYALGPITPNYEARLIGDDIGKPGLGLGTYRDFRGIPAFQPFTLQYELYLKPRTYGTTVTLQWSLPLDGRIVAAQLQDRFNIAYSVDMTSAGFVQIRGGLQRFIVTVTYNGLVPTNRFTLTTLDVPLGAGVTTKFPDQPDYAAGQSVTLTASPMPGFKFNSWQGDTVVPAVAVLPVAMWKSKTIAAVYEQLPPPVCTITTNVSPDPSTGRVKIFPAKTTYNCGELLQLTAEPANCWKFSRWIGDTTSFDPVLNVLLWRDRNIVAEFIPDPPTLSATSVPGYGGTILKTPDYPAYSCNDVVVMRAFPNPGFQFIGWEGDTIVLGQATIAVPMYKSRRIVARFCDISQGNCGSVITVETAPAGLEFSVDGVSYTNAHIFVWQLGEKHEIGVPPSMQTQMLQGTQWTRYRFKSWWPNLYQPVFDYTVNAPAAKFTARFTEQHAVVTEDYPANGGRTAVSPPSPDGFYDDSTMILLTAVPNSGWKFVNYTGDVNDTLNPKGVLVNAPKRIRANYTDKINPVTTAITLITSPPNLSLVVDGTIHQSPVTFRWIAGEQHEISVPAGFQTQYGPGGVNSGIRYLFTDWDDGGPATHTIIVTGRDRTYRADFLTQYQLKVNIDPLDGGVVNVWPAAPDGYYDAASVAVLKALPNARYLFDRWMGDVAPKDTLPDLQLVMNMPRNVTAQFLLRSTEEVPVQILSAPTGLSVAVDGSILTTPVNARWLPDDQHDINVPAALLVQYPSGGARTRHQFDRWNLGPMQEYRVTARANGTRYTASFKTQHQLITESVPPGGGAVTTLPSDPEGFYPEGSSLQLTAAANIGYRFLKWTSPDSADQPNKSIGVTMWKPKSFRAQFEYTGAGRICLSPTTAAFESCPTDEAFPSPQALTMQNCGYDPVRWNSTIAYLDSARGWLRVEPDSGTLQPSQTITLLLRITRRLGPGDHGAEITINAQNADNPVTKIQVLYRVSQRPHFEVLPKQLAFAAKQFDPQLPPPQTVQFADYTPCAVQWSVKSDSPWVQLSQTGGASNGVTISVGVTRNDLPLGVHGASIIFTSPQADNSPIVLPLSYEIRGAAPAAPDSLTASKVDDHSISLQWQDLAFNEDGYYVERQDEKTGRWDRIGKTDRNQSFFLDRGLEACKRYVYRVQAYNESGVSLYSNEASGTTCREKGTLTSATAYIYPNPVRDKGTFSFTLAKSADVTIKIVDPANVVVRTFRVSRVEADDCNTQVTWDGTNEGGEGMANGVYFFIIETSAGERAVGKIALLK